MSCQPKGEINGTSPKGLLANIPRYFLLHPFILPYALHIHWPSSQRGRLRVTPLIKQVCFFSDMELFDSSQESFSLSENSSSPPSSVSVHPECKVWTKTQTPFCWAGYATNLHTPRDTTTTASKHLQHLKGGGSGRGESFLAMKM